MTSWAALASSGPRDGCRWVDIVVFNPDTVTDNSTYEPGKGALPSTGIPYVLVNGVVVVKDSVVQKVFPGKPIRFPVMEQGRLDQISIEPREFVPNQSP